METTHDWSARIRTNENRFELSMPYEMQFRKEGLVQNLKRIGGRWAPAIKAWTLPLTPTSAKTLIEFFDDQELENHHTLTALAQVSDQSTQAKHADKLPDIPNGRTSAWHHQRRAYHFAKDLPGAMLAMGMGPQPLDALVITPDGPRKIGELLPGDEIIGNDGKPTKVTEIFDKGKRLIYEITFSDKKTARCCEEHLWTVQTPKQKHRKSQPKTITLKEIIQKGLKTSSKWWKWFIPITAPVEFKKQETGLPIDPYLLGILLGDGGLTTSTIILTTPEQEILDKIKTMLPENIKPIQYSEISYGLTKGSNSNGKNQLLEQLRELGLMGHKSSTKFIPEIYLYSSIENRIKLLQGLLDTDGFTDKRSNSQIEYSTSSEKLSNDFNFLIMSLGGTATTSIKKTKCLDSYRSYVKLPKEIQPFTLKRKHERYNAEKCNPTRSIRKIKPLRIEETRCISIENEDGLYLTDNFIVTHNTGKTKSAIGLIVNRPHDMTLIVCPKSVMTVWPAEFEKHTDENFFIKVLTKGSTKQKACDAELARKMAKAKKLPLVIITNYDGYWREALAKWISDQEWDQVIFDESHRIKAPQGKAARFAGTVGSKAKYRLGLTGTPMPHSPLDIYAQYRAIDQSVFGTVYHRFQTRYAVKGGFGGKQVIGFQREEELREKFDSIAIQVGAEVLDLPETIESYRTCELSPRARKIYDELDKDLFAAIDEGEITPANAMVKLLRLQQITSGYASLDDAETPVQIDTSKRELLADILEEIPVDEPVVVFARFTADIAGIRWTAEKHGRTTGELSGHANDLKDWQDGKTNLLAVQIRSGGVGIDLTRACYCLYYSMGHSLGDYQQSLARTHRPGQTRTVRYYHLLAEATVDKLVYQALQQKQEIIEAILNYRQHKEAD